MNPPDDQQLGDKEVYYGPNHGRLQPKSRGREIVDALRNDPERIKAVARIERQMTWESWVFRPCKMLLLVISCVGSGTGGLILGVFVGRALPGGLDDIVGLCAGVFCLWLVVSNPIWDRWIRQPMRLLNAEWMYHSGYMSAERFNAEQDRIRNSRH